MKANNESCCARNWKGNVFDSSSHDLSVVPPTFQNRALYPLCADHRGKGLIVCKLLQSFFTMLARASTRVTRASIWRVRTLDALGDRRITRPTLHTCISAFIQLDETTISSNLLGEFCPHCWTAIDELESRSKVSIYKLLTFETGFFKHF